MHRNRGHIAITETAEHVFGSVLREVRKGQGLSQQKLASESGYHATYIGQLERGVKSPSLRTIMSLAAVLQTPSSELLRRLERRLPHWIHVAVTHRENQLGDGDRINSQKIPP
jgi:transcriptional regulator with XRE-family HTH domain